MKIPVPLLLTLVSMLLQCSCAFAGDAPLTGATLNTPESAASAIIGGSTKSITHAGSPSDFGVTILNGFDGAGHLQAGLGLEVAPLPFLSVISSEPWVAPDKYRKDALLRFASRLNVSLATAKGTGSGKNPVALGFGLSGTFFDLSDPGMDGSETNKTGLLGCLRAGEVAESDATRAYLNGHPEASDAEIDDAIHVEIYSKRYKKCFKDASIRLWNRSAWNFSVAESVTSQMGTLAGLKDDAYAFNSSFTWGFDDLSTVPLDLDSWSSRNWLYKNAQLIFGVQYLKGVMVSDPDPSNKGQFYKQNSWQVGTQFRTRLFGLSSGKDALNAADTDALFTFKNTLVSLEYVYIRNDPSGRPNNSEMTVTLGLEFLIAEGTYLDVGIGADRKMNGGKTDGFALTQLKYNFGNSSNLFAR